MNVAGTNAGFYAVSLCKTLTALPVKIVPGKDVMTLVESRGLWEESSRWNEETAAHRGGNAGAARLTVSSLLPRAKECDRRAQRERQG